MTAMETFTLTRSYAVPPAELVELLLDPDFVAEKARRSGDVGAPTVERSGASARLVIPRRVPVDGVPPAFRPFVPPRVTQVEDWQVSDAGAEASWRVEANTPATVTGRHTIRAEAGGCEHEITGSVTVAVPFVGGKAEKLLADFLQKLCADEEAQAAQRLTR
jgi:hypothetical protein